MDSRFNHNNGLSSFGLDPAPTAVPTTASPPLAPVPAPAPVAVVYAPGEELFLPTEDPMSPPTDVRLVHVMAAVVRVFTVVLQNRVVAGDIFRARCLAASAQLCVAELAALLPTPTLPDLLPNGFYPSAFAAALDPLDTPFDRKQDASAPSLRRWLGRLFKEGGCSPAVFLAVLVYVDRLLEKCPALMLTSDNVHRVVAACFVIACKELEDRHMWMSGFARLTGIPRDELVGLEVAMLRLLDHDTHIRVEDFAEAEAAFMAEAMDTPTGFKVMLHLVRHGVNVGLDAAISRVKGWTQTAASTLPEGSSAGYPAASSMDPVFYPTYTFEGNQVWRPVVECGDGLENNSKLRALAIALMNHQFPGIALHPLPGLEGQPEWQVLGICGIPGVERFQLLRDLILKFGVEKAAAPLPPLCKRMIPFSAALPLAQNTPGMGLGPNGLFLLSSHWDFALASELGENPWKEVVEYGEEDIIIPRSDEESKPYDPYSPRPRDLYDMTIHDTPIVYPPGFKPSSPAVCPESRNGWWSVQNRLRREQEAMAREVAECLATDTGHSGCADNAPPLGTAAPAPRSDAPLRGDEAMQEGAEMESGNSDALLAGVLPPTPAVPTGFMPPQRTSPSISVHLLLNIKDEEEYRSSASGDGTTARNDQSMESNGRQHENGGLAFASYAAVTGNGIWADAPNPVGVEPVSAAGGSACFVNDRHRPMERRDQVHVARGGRNGGMHPGDGSLAQWLAQDALPADTLNARQVAATLQRHRGGNALMHFAARNDCFRRRDVLVEGREGDMRGTLASIQSRFGSHAAKIDGRNCDELRGMLAAHKVGEASLRTSYRHEGSLVGRMCSRRKGYAEGREPVHAGPSGPVSRRVGQYSSELGGVIGGQVNGMANGLLDGGFAARTGNKHDIAIEGPGFGRRNFLRGKKEPTGAVGLPCMVNDTAARVSRTGADNPRSGSVAGSAYGSREAFVERGNVARTGALSRTHTFGQHGSEGNGLRSDSIEAVLEACMNVRCETGTSRKGVGQGGQAANLARSATKTQSGERQADDETDESPTVVLGMWFKIAEDDPDVFVIPPVV